MYSYFMLKNKLLKEKKHIEDVVQKIMQEVLRIVNINKANKKLNKKMKEELDSIELKMNSIINAL